MEPTRLDPSQLTLPQIAAAVAAGDLRLADAEAELRRRPSSDPPRWQRREPPAAPRGPSPADVVRALEETRRELRKATRNLAQLSERFETLAQAASKLQVSPPTRASVAGRPQRNLRRGALRGSSRSNGEPQPLDDLFDGDSDAPSHFVAA